VAISQATHFKALIILQTRMVSLPSRYLARHGPLFLKKTRTKTIYAIEYGRHAPKTFAHWKIRKWVLFSEYSALSQREHISTSKFCVSTHTYESRHLPSAVTMEHYTYKKTGASGRNPSPLPQKAVQLDKY